MVENIQQVIKEYKDTRKLQVLSLCILSTKSETNVRHFHEDLRTLRKKHFKICPYYAFSCIINYKNTHFNFLVIK